MRVPIELMDNSTGQFVCAELFDEITVEHFIETRDKWRPLILEAKTKIMHQGHPKLVPRYSHWDWTTKEPDLGLLAVQFFGIEYGGNLQGIVEVQTVGYECRIPAQQGKALVYIDYLQVAPWNIKLLMEPLGRRTLLGGVGTRLIEAVIRFSEDEGFKGRVGLHSLPGSEEFYINSCGMTQGGKDPAKENLLWCEFTPAQAQTFLAGGMR